ncbi:MAG TPA: sigma-54 dependent transcriptional regulator, partial [Candidatus Hydrogenedentes bacterium]|nr:sigma-54 dependent transcriptional regulator [Candidatus Hydrogenedentota bacterium]
DLDELLTVIEDCLGLGPRDQDALDLPPGIVAESETLRNLFRQAFRVAPTSAAVLLTGESGTGKEIFARLIHARSNRASGPMVTVNMGAVPEQLAESELFGHEKGAFTGADTSRAGRFEEADGGTLFLDEIGELPLSLQPKLLRVLETGEFRRIGGTTDRRANVRVIAATNRDLEREVTAGRFREDLFYRLNVFPLRIPPLRERREDIIPLAELFLGPWKKRLSPAAARLLAAWSWPGNARELRNVVERAAILADGDMILPEDLPDALRNAPRSDRPDAPGRPLMEEAQRRAIREALEKTGGNRTKAAQLLGISRRSLIYKLRAYGL